MAPDAYRLAMGILYLAPTLVWGVLCERTWYFSRTHRPRNLQFRLLPFATGCLAAHMALVAVFWLLPADVHRQRPAGTGLGLAIVKRTVDAHGGQIAAVGSPGGGLAFDIALPLAGDA